MFWTILSTIYNLKLLNIVHFISQYCSELFAELFVKLYFIFCWSCTQYKWKFVWYMHQIVQNCLQYCCYPMIAGTTQGLASVRGLPNPGPRRTWKKSELSGAPRNSDSKTCRLESRAKTPVIFVKIAQYFVQCQTLALPHSLTTALHALLGGRATFAGNRRYLPCCAGTYAWFGEDELLDFECTTVRWRPEERW